MLDSFVGKSRADSDPRIDSSSDSESEESRPNPNKLEQFAEAADSNWPIELGSFAVCIACCLLLSELSSGSKRFINGLIPAMGPDDRGSIVVGFVATADWEGRSLLGTSKSESDSEELKEALTSVCLEPLELLNFGRAGSSMTHGVSGSGPLRSAAEILIDRDLVRGPTHFSFSFSDSAVKSVSEFC